MQTEPKLRALVVDDDVGVRMLTREALEQLDLIVDEASNGAEALEIFEQSQPSFVLLDVQMPKMNGFEACSRIRSLPGGADTSIVIITSRDDYASILQAYESGATDFMTKPVKWPMLVHRVRYLLRAQEAFRLSRENEARLSESQRIAHLGNLDCDIDSDTAQWSEETYHILGLSSEFSTASYKTFLQAVHPLDREAVSRAVVNAMEESNTYSIEHRILRPDGDERTLHTQGKIEYDNSGRPARMRAVVQDISERKNAEERIYRLSFYDELTGLPNRELFLEHAKRAISGAQRSGFRVVVIHVNLDRFKRINDSLGHAGGNELLKIVADRLAACIRQSDLVAKAQVAVDVRQTLARPGADEFMVLLTGLLHSEGAANFVSRALKQLTQPLAVANQELFVTGSVGIAVYPEDGDDMDTLLKNADIALNHAKQAGGNCFRFYSVNMNNRALERLSLEAKLNHAMQRGEFELYFQPQTDLSSGQTVGLEALLRWNSADHGQIPPGQFIPVAEESKLILDIGEWVLAAACNQLDAWQRDGYALVPLAINLSPHQFVERDLVQTIDQTLSASTFDSKYLELELTESAIMRDVEQTQRKLHRLKELGLKIAVDDFGTGYSSMSYLKRFPLDTLKIDRSFVLDLGLDPNDTAIIEAIIALTKSLGLLTIAEGVETADQRNILAELGCDWMQGYLISRPVPAHEIVTFLTRRPDGG